MEFSAYDISLVPLLVILIQLIKYMAKPPARLLPLIAVILGQVAAFVYVSPDDFKYAVLAGLIMTFSAMGLWSGTKNLIGK